MAKSEQKKTAAASVDPESTGLSLIADLGDGMKLYMALLDKLREQDVNARILPTSEHNTLVNNIRNRGRLESVPYCVLNNGQAEIVSGHHRVRAAREAGVTEAPVLVDESGLSRSEIVAKQLAHNRIQGFDDPETLRRLFSILDTPDLILASGLADDLLELPLVDLESGITPYMDMGWKTVTLTFLPHQLKNFTDLIDAIPPSDLVGVAGVEQYERFMEAALKYARLRDIRNIGTALALLSEVALEQNSRLEAIAAEGEEAKDD